MGGFKCGQIVRLRGLSNAAYNGKLALVKGLPAIDGGERHLVEVQDEDGEIDIRRGGNYEVIRIKPENMAHACNHCRNADVAKMQFCSKCRMAGYCNAECQRNDWQRHKVAKSLAIRVKS
jgi:hypothetical protein